MRNFMHRLAGRAAILISSFVIQLYSGAQGLSPETQTHLQQVLQTFQNDPMHPFIGGISAAIKIDGLAQWQGASGYASRNIDAANNLLPGGTPFTTATLSRTYSVTKTFTAALVLELARSGAFSLDNPISNFLPLNLINPQLNNSVTIRQLLAHESGYSDFLQDINLQVAVAFQPTRTWTPFEVLTFAHQDTIPGVIRHYSSTNYIVLGAIVEAVTGKPIEQHFRERFFNPLHLNSMYLAGREPIGNHGTLADPHDDISALNPVFQLTGQPTFPSGYTNIRVFPFHAIETISFTSGGIVSNASDMAEWGSALFGGRATSLETRNMMVQSISTTPDEDGDFLGYGIWRTTKISSTDIFWGHDGNATGYRSVMFYQPDKKLTIAILTNFHGANLYAIAKALYEALPDFTCGNKKEDKIEVCWNGHTQCIARPAATNLVRKGAYLGACNGMQHSEGNENHEAENEKSALLSTPENAHDVSTLQIFPNPAIGQATITISNVPEGKLQLDVYNANGKLVKTIFSAVVEKTGTRTFHLPTQQFSAGMYLVRVTTAKNIQQEKMVILK